MKIVAAGDSFTYGEELSDRQNAWPYILGRKLNSEVVNLAQPAGSNDKIVRKTLEYILSEPGTVDLVVIAWASPGRMELADQHGIFDIWPGYSGNLFIKNNSYWRNDICKYITVYHNDLYLYQKYLQQVILLQSFLELQNIKYVMADVDPFIYHVDSDATAPYFNKINKDKFIQFKKEGFVQWAFEKPKGPYGHFLDEGHKIVADKYYEHIGNLGWLS